MKRTYYLEICLFSRKFQCISLNFYLKLYFSREVQKQPWGVLPKATHVRDPNDPVPISFLSKYSFLLPDMTTIQG
jgi:hypothetical protein